MADEISDKRRRAKKKRSSLLTWKKKFNIKKRFTNKLPLHRRHIRALMSGWSLSDVRSVLTQYEITAMLKQLSIMADKSRPSCPSLSQDMSAMFKTSSCCDVKLTCCDLTEDECRSNHQLEDHHPVFEAHKAFLANRWPDIHTKLKSSISNQKRPFHEAAFSPPSENLSPQKNAYLSNVHLTGIKAEKLSEILTEIYEGTKSGLSQPHPRKLLPLPTTDDSLHLRNSRGLQTFRHTILECDQQPVTRRSVVRRKQKQRFSMDERILSNQLLSPSSSRGQQTRSCKLVPSEVLQNASYNRTTVQVSECNSSRSSGDKAVPNFLQDDLLSMYQEAKAGNGDLKLVFSFDSLTSFTSWMTPHSRRRDFSNHYQAWISHYESSNFFPSSSREWQDPLYCHKVVLAARSKYFRKLIEKQMLSAGWWESNTTSTLEIDGTVIPPRYMSAVLYTMYTDKIDIHQMYERFGQNGMPMGAVPGHFQFRDAMMLHHIGCFIEFPQLVYGCEEFIVNSLDQKNLPQVLHWTSLPHGSNWVKRQVNSFIRERFTELLSTGVLFELNASQIIDVLKSDFVNAAELDILKCALRWGEHELLRRIEKREPNLLTHTAHSVSRSKTASARRREIIASRIEELHECTAPVLACVRMQHLLPSNHELFTNAVKHGVISRPPADLLENVGERESCSRQWIKSRMDFIPPRLFQPYVDETRNILDERFAQESDCVSLRSVHNFSRDQTWCSVRRRMELATHGIPDALYMVGQARLSARGRYGNRNLQSNFTPSRDTPNRTTMKHLGDFHPVPNTTVLREMLTRERELRSTYTVNKVLRACIDCSHNDSRLFGGAGLIGRSQALSNNASGEEDSDEMEYCNRCTAMRLVRLFVVRERGLPDCAVDLLQRPEMYYTFAELRNTIATDRGVSLLRPERPARTTARLENHRSGSTPEDRIQGNGMRVAPNANLIRSFKSTAFKEPLSGSVVIKKNKFLPPQRVDAHPSCSIPSSSLNTNILPHPVSLSLSDSSSSSCEEEEVFHARRKKRSLSRKGSSSTTSYQSIPDVAASANSSLQRLRAEAPRRSPLAVPNASPTPDSRYFATKFTETETCDSSSSSCEENTSDNECFGFDPRSSQDQDELFCSEARALSGSKLAGEIPTERRTASNLSGAQSECENARKRPQKVYPPKRPISTELAGLFQSSLNFIDDNPGSSDDNFGQILSPNDPSTTTPTKLDVPELVKDGTLPRAGGSHLTDQGRSFSDRPDIYPVGGEDGCDFSDQCGKYFFCSLTRDKMLGRKDGEDSPARSRASFSFAINNQKPEPPRKPKERSSEATLFL